MKTMLVRERYKVVQVYGMETKQVAQENIKHGNSNLCSNNGEYRCGSNGNVQKIGGADGETHTKYVERRGSCVVDRPVYGAVVPFDAFGLLVDSLQWIWTTYLFDRFGEWQYS